jgi:hypothetical protein
LDPDWSEWFEGLSVETSRDASGAPLTVISGPVTDQAALQGLLTKIWNLNLPILAVKCLSGYSTEQEM